MQVANQPRIVAAREKVPTVTTVNRRLRIAAQAPSPSALAKVSATQQTSRLQKLYKSP
jgi:hypothetical protein